jgi:hypothetical protein
MILSILINKCVEALLHCNSALGTEDMEYQLIPDVLTFSEPTGNTVLVISPREAITYAKNFKNW